MDFCIFYICNTAVWIVHYNCNTSSSKSAIIKKWNKVRIITKYVKSNCLIPINRREINPFIDRRLWTNLFSLHYSNFCG